MRSATIERPKALHAIAIRHTVETMALRRVVQRQEPILR